MNNMKRYIFIFLYIITFFGTPTTFVIAQSDTPVIDDYVVLAPLPGTTKDPNCTGTTCVADINSYLGGFLGLAISIGAIIAMLYLAFYGFQYAISDSPSVKMETKGKLFEIFTGLLLIISAYAIMYTINPDLVNNLSLEITEPKITAPAVNVTSETTGGTGRTFTQNPDPAGDKVIRDRLTTNTGISINRTNPCTVTQRTGCTTLTDLPELAINGVLTLKKECGCNLMITGGTETLPHGGGVNTQHGPGLAVIDLNPSSQLNTYLGKPNPQEKDLVFKTINGRQVVFTFEKAGGNASHSSTGDHWHVQFK